MSSNSISENMFFNTSLDSLAHYGVKDSSTTSDKAYEKAARNYLKEHPNSTMSVAELAAKYKKEWTEGNK